MHLKDSDITDYPKVLTNWCYLSLRSLPAAVQNIDLQFLDLHDLFTLQASWDYCDI